MNLKIHSWNVNGIRAVVKKGFQKYLDKYSPDILCLQETKAKQNQVDFDFERYAEVWNSAVRPGYSGTAIFAKKDIDLKNVIKGVEIDGSVPAVGDSYGGKDFDEGRVMTADLDKFYLVNVYTPNSKPKLERLEYRQKTWDPMFLKYLKHLEKTKPVVVCGDFNVAHKEIDIARPDSNRRNAGFTDEERAGMDNYLESGFIDTFRFKHPKEVKYTYWSYFAKSRERNVGWRIDYFLISDSLKDNLESAEIYDEVHGSDHCPLEIEINF